MPKRKGGSMKSIQSAARKARNQYYQKHKKAGSSLPAGGTRRKRKAGSSLPAGGTRRKRKAGSSLPAGSVRRKKKAGSSRPAGGYVPGKFLTKMTIGRMISALKKHWKK